MPDNDPAIGHYLDGLFLSEDPDEIQTFFDCPVGPRCDAADRLGIEHGTPLNIPDENFSASSTDSTGARYSTPSSARLNYPGAYPLIGGWKAASTAVGSWIQVELGVDAIVTGVITQGRNVDETSHLCWVTLFQVKYASMAKVNLVDVTSQDGTPKVFNGNTDGTTEVTTSFPQPVIASIIRLLPVAWVSQVVLRFELLGCLQSAETTRLIREHVSI
ncbi:retinoschisin-like [Asterias rubens]|uniref:retinoschisin-like n=1 Tax=Asterias rubens TaxID=7604 RepID=UPI0014555862|nr:retinoschisin-like [Asterias rubens]